MIAVASKWTRGQCARLGYLAGLGLSVEAIMKASGKGGTGPKPDPSPLGREEDACRKEVTHVTMKMETI